MSTVAVAPLNNLQKFGNAAPSVRSASATPNDSNSSQTIASPQHPGARISTVAIASLYQDRKFSTLAPPATSPSAKTGDNKVSPATAATQPTAPMRTIAVTALYDNRRLAVDPDHFVADEPGSNQVETAVSDVSDARAGSHPSPASSSAPSSAARADDVGPLAAMVATQVVTPAGDARVPDQDTTDDFRKQPFSLGVVNEATSTPSAILTLSQSNSSNDAAPAQTNVDAGILVAPLSHHTEVTHTEVNPAHDGTSPALSSQGASSGLDTMTTANQKQTSSTSAYAPTDAAASSAQPAARPQLEGVAPIGPQDPYARGANPKEAVPVPTIGATNVPSDPAGSAQTQPAAQAPEAAAIRQAPEVSAASAPAHSVNITVQLANGQAAQASVREHAGTVDVRISTPSAASAQRVSSEIDGMRQNLKAAGMSLGRSEVSYQQGDGGSQRREQYGTPEQKRSADEKDIFVMNEVNQ